MARATARDQIDPRFRTDMERLAQQPGAIRIGTSALDPSLAVSLNLPDLLGAGHGLVLGRTGTGKTRLVVGIIRELLRLFVLSPSSARIYLTDFKGDLATLIRDLIAELVDQLPPQHANRLIDALVVIDPFAEGGLVPLNVLAREPDSPVPPEAQAYEVASMFERMTRAPTGVVQDQLLFSLLLMGVCDGHLGLPDLVPLIMDPAARAAVAARSPNADVRRFFVEARPVPVTSAAGLQARFSRLLRLPATRLMLGARGCIDFRSLMRDKIVVANLGNPPLGCEDIARWWGGLITLKTTRAIFERSPEEAGRPVLMAVDEWQEGLAAGDETAENYERVLAMARSRGVALMLISQSLAGAARISSSLPKVVATNTSHQALFSAASEDAKAMAHMLPVTGRHPREPAQPWEERPKSPYLTAPEELARLVDGVTHLPDRTYYFWQRRVPYKAQLVRALDVDVEVPAFLPVETARRLRVGSAAVPIAELERPPLPLPPPALTTDVVDDPTAILGPPRWPRVQR
ncbi:MAG: DUF87 domain-containing protein [Polyangia bacterium]